MSNIIIFTYLLFVCCIVLIAAGPLDEYVFQNDGVYNWTINENYLIESDIYGGFKAYGVNLVSCRWLTDEIFASQSPGKSIWKHQMVIIVPNTIKYENEAAIWITGGGQNDGWPDTGSEDIQISIALAVTANIVVAALFQISNQPVIFADDPQQRGLTEDALIAYTWDHFLNDSSNPEWLNRFPMVKASARALDCITEFMQFKYPQNQVIDSFTVSGASKRGWVTWLLAAVDRKRVKRIVPVVLDAMNFREFCHHQWKSYNGFSFALEDYQQRNIFGRVDDKNMILLAQYEDPYFYIERLTMPKLVVNAVLDEFQQPDDTNFWWDDMPEPKHFLMVPNAEHSMITGVLEAVPAMSNWLQKQLLNERLPSFTWTISNTTGEIIATLDEIGEVYQAHVYFAYSCGTNNEDGVKRRDFRIANIDNPCHCGIFAEGYCANVKSIWQKKLLQETLVNNKRTYSIVMDAPEDGRYVAYFIQIKYRKHFDDAPPSELEDFLDKISQRESKRPGLIPIDIPGRLDFNTQVSIWPNTFPFADCSHETCDGPLR